MPDPHKLEGARLENMMQNLVYKHIHKRKRINPLIKTGKETIERTMNEIKAIGLRIEENNI